MSEEWRAGRGMKGTDSFEPSPLIVCRVCGHQEHIGGVMRFEGSENENEDEDEATRTARLARVRAEQAVQRWYSDKMTLMGVTFPIYAAEGWPAQINGSGSHGDDLTFLVIAHADTLSDSTPAARPSIKVTSSIDPHQPDELSIALETWAHHIAASDQELPDGLSDAAVTLWFRAARRRRVAGSHEAPASQIRLTIDGVGEPLVTVGVQDSCWVAVRRHHDVTITIVARDIDLASLIIEPMRSNCPPSRSQARRAVSHFRPNSEIDELRCSFCGKPRTAVEDVVCGPTPTVTIRNECIELCADIMAEQRMGQNSPP